MSLVVCTSNEILQKVSRSFALCIPLLEKNKIREVETMYILSRVADTIEDSSLSVKEKKALMADFFRTLEGEDAGEFLQKLQEGIIDDNDRVLAVRKNYEFIIHTFHSLDGPARDISLKLLKEMSSGMIEYLDKDIITFEDLDNYCYYVAGTVGLYMNSIVELRDGIKLDEKGAVSLGRYLQKVNVIKNFHKESQEGRNFWPTSLFGGIEGNIICKGEHRKEATIILEKMIENATAEATESFDYIASVPYTLQGYRKFLLLSAFMATENLKLIKNNQEVFTNPNGIKIPRFRIPEIAIMVEEAAASNEALWKFKKELETTA